MAKSDLFYSDRKKLQMFVS